MTQQTNQQGADALITTPLATWATLGDVHIKAMVWGAPGAGKSRLALSFPTPMVADLEKSTSLYAGQFRFMRAEPTDKVKAVTLVDTLVKQIKAGMYPEVETFIIDPITVYLDALKDGLMTRLKKEGLDMATARGLAASQGYAKINQAIENRLREMLELPVNIVWVARERNLWGETDKGMAPIGKTFDAKDEVEYLADVVINLQKGGVGHVKKSRLAELPTIIKAASYVDIKAAMDLGMDAMPVPTEPVAEMTIPDADEGIPLEPINDTPPPAAEPAKAPTGKAATGKATAPKKAAATQQADIVKEWERVFGPYDENKAPIESHLRAFTEKDRLEDLTSEEAATYAGVLSKMAPRVQEAPTVEQQDLDAVPF